jgi:hypothetical protein
VTVSDETGWEFETLKHAYANSGLDATGETTGLAWKIVKRSPAGTALEAEESRVEKFSFAVEPRDGSEFTIKATVRYHYAPAAQEGTRGEAEPTKMAEASVTLPGKRPF